MVNYLSNIHGKPRHIDVILMKIPKYFPLTLKKENIHDNLIFPRKSNTALLHVCSLSSIGLGISLHFIGAKKILGEFRSVVKDTKSNTKNFTKSISIHSDYQSVHFW